MDNFGSVSYRYRKLFRLWIDDITNIAIAGLLDYSQLDQTAASTIFDTIATLAKKAQLLGGHVSPSNTADTQIVLPHNSAIGMRSVFVRGMSPIMDSRSNADSDAVPIKLFQYLMASVPHSLYRNGKVFTRRDKDGSDAGRGGVDLEAGCMRIHDVRCRKSTARCTLTQNGFGMRAQRICAT